MGRAHRGWVGLLLLALTSLSSPASAEEDRAAEAEAEMVKARRAMERQEFEAAVGHLLVARSLAPEASGPYLNLGLSYAALGKCDQAVPVLEEYLRRKTKDPQPSAAATLAACRAALAPPTTTVTEPVKPTTTTLIVPPPSPPPPPPRPGKLVVKISPVPADVTLNGARIAKQTRLVEREQPAGGYTLTVEQRGYHTWSRYGWLPDGETAVEQVKLRRRRVWPAGVGALAAVATVGGLITLGVVVASTPRPTSETTFSTETVLP